MLKKEWFSSWFDTKYYALLYRDRSDNEAKQFVDKLMDYYKPVRGTTILDMGCGNGRFSRYLNDYGMKVTGIDISPAVIKKAISLSPASIEFECHDIRRAFRPHYYDFIFSFFTSFGYFDTDEEHVVSIKNAYEGLRIHGVFLLDYLNADRISINLPQKSVQVIQGITFNIHKYMKGGYFIKEIDVHDNGREYKYFEKVRAYTLRDFKTLFSKTGLQITACYGDYDLNPFDILNSKRLIITGVKK